MPDLFPYIKEGDWEAINRFVFNVENSLGKIDTGGRSILMRFGVGTLSWGAGTSLSNQLSTAHGLGKIPSVAFATVKTSGQGEVVAAHATADATNVIIQAQWVAGFVPGVSTLSVSWLVIG